MKKISVSKKEILAIIFFSMVPFHGFAQEFTNGPSTGIMDSKSVFANPAVLSFQNGQVSLGVKGYYLGFFEETGIGYKEGYFSFLTPRIRGSRFGGGLQVQYFNSPIFRKGQYGTTLSYRILNNLSVGANASLYHLGYNQDNFTGFDPGDPVFQEGFSRFALNAAAGIYFRPVSSVELAMGGRNLTEPNMSLISDNVTEPMEMFGGISLRHNILKGTFELIHGQFGLQSRIHAEAYSSSGYYLRLGTYSNFDSGYIEAQAHITRGYSINYQFLFPFNELSGRSSGTHMFSLVYEFNKVPSLPDRREPPRMIPSLERPPVQPAYNGSVLLSSQTDHVMYYEKQIVRRVDDSTISEDEIQALSLYDIGELGDDPRQDRIPYSGTRLPNVPIPETVQFSTSVSDNYNEALELLGEILNSEQLEQLSIIYNEGTQIRAAGLRNLLFENSGKSVPVNELLLENENDTIRFQTAATIDMFEDEQLIEIQPQNAEIEVILTQNIPIRGWNLEITDINDVVIRSIRGGTSLPDVIEWDWLDNTGELIEPGVFTYVLNWTSADGSVYRSNVRSLYVQKILRKITIDITKDLNRILQNPDSIDMILKNN